MMGTSQEGSPPRVYTRRELLALKPPGLYKGILEDLTPPPPPSQATAAPTPHAAPTGSEGNGVANTSSPSPTSSTTSPTTSRPGSNLPATGPVRVHSQQGRRSPHAETVGSAVATPSPLGQTPTPTPDPSDTSRGASVSPTKGGGGGGRPYGGAAGGGASERPLPRTGPVRVASGGPAGGAGVAPPSGGGTATTGSVPRWRPAGPSGSGGGGGTGGGFPQTGPRPAAVVVARGSGGGAGGHTSLHRGGPGSAGGGGGGGGPQRGPPPGMVPPAAAQRPGGAGAGGVVEVKGPKKLYSIAYIESIPAKYPNEISFVPQSFPPRFARILKAGVQRRRAQQRQGGGRVPGGRGAKKNLVIKLNRPSRASLHSVDNAWGAKVKAKVQGKIEIDPDEAVQKTANGIFNKITKKSSAKLTDQLMNIGIDSKKRMQLVLDALFERALDFHEQCPLYASVCGKLQTLEVNDDGKPLNFRELLITKCVSTFDIVTSEDGVKTQLAGGKGATLSEDQKKAKAKRLLLGFMVFMGELYITSIINLDIVSNCIETIIGLCPKGEEYLECACKLMQTVGQTLDKQKVKATESWFLRLQQMEDLPTIKKRMVFTIENLIDLRLNGWRGPTPPGKPRKRMRDRSGGKPGRLASESASEPPTPDVNAGSFDLEPAKVEEAAAAAAAAAEEAERARVREAEEKLKSTIRASIDEYREQRIIEELLQDMANFTEKGVVKQFFVTVFDKFLECKESDIDGYETLIAELAARDKIPGTDYAAALNECLEVLPDLALDAPSASNRFGVAVGAGLAHNLCSHEIFESEFFEELSMRSMTVVLIEVLVTLANYPERNADVSKTCTSQIEAVFELVSERFGGKEERARVASGLLRKGILDHNYLDPLPDAEKVEKYLELATPILTERGARDEDVDKFLSLLGEQLGSLFDDAESLRNDVVAKLIAAKPSAEAKIIAALAEAADMTADVSEEELRQVIDKYAVAEDEEDQLEEYIEDIQERGGDESMIRFCELVCEKMAMTHGEDEVIEGILRLASTVASSEDVTSEHWQTALLNVIPRLTEIAAKTKNAGTRLAWAIGLGITESHCELNIFEQEPFGRLPAELRVEVFTATLTHVGSQLGSEGIDDAKLIKPTMLYGSDPSEIRAVADKLADFKQLSSFLPPRPQ